MKSNKIRLSIAFCSVLILCALPFCANGAVESDQLLKQLIRSKKPGYVYDFAGVVQQRDATVIKSVSRTLEQKTGSQIKLVTLPSLKGGEIRDVATRLFEGWGIGQRGKDNGLLILMAQQEREIWIEVGYGLEGGLPDAVVGDIIDRIIIPAFKEGRYSEGLVNGTVRAAQLVAREYNVSLDGEMTGAPPDKREKRGISIIDILVFIGLGYLAIRHPFLFLMILSSGRGGRGGGGGFSGGGFGGGMSGGGGAGGRW